MDFLKTPGIKEMVRLWLWYFYVFCIFFRWQTVSDFTISTNYGTIKHRRLAEESIYFIVLGQKGNYTFTQIDIYF